MRSLLLAVVFVVPACVGEVSGTVQLSLQADATGRLAMNGSPVDPAYHATYSNPRAISRMQVTLSGTGRLVGTCSGAHGAVTCGDVPFYSRVQLTETGRIVRAWDTHGQLVVMYNCAGGPEVCGNDDEAEADEDDEADCEDDHDDGTGEDDEGGATGEEGGGSGTPTECPPAPTDCTALQTWAQDCLCTVVNNNLAEFGVAYTVDCAGLDGAMETPEIDTDYDGDIACQDDLIGEGGESVEEASEACPTAEVTVNNLISSIDYELRSQGLCGHSPLILDLAGDGVALARAEEGVRFDLLGRGEAVACAWVRGDDALLVLDRDGNGTIDGGAELFGTATGGASFADGFQALADLDADGSGRLDDGDPDFRALRLLGADGALVPLAAAGVRSLGLQARRLHGRAAWDGRGNRIPLLGDFERADGTRAPLVDAWLRFLP